MSSKKPKISLAWQMMIGLALGVVVGALVEQETAKTFLQPLGDLFIRLIRMVVVPLVLATIIAGALMMEHLGETGVSGRMERAVSAAMASGRIRSKDMGGSSSTSEIGDIITKYLDRV